MIKRTLLALLLGSAASFYHLQDDTHVKQVIQEHLISFLESAFDCSVTCTLKNFTFIRPSIELQNVVMSSKDNSKQWRMSSNIVRVGCSWLSLLCYATLDLNMYSKKLRINSDVVDGSPSIIDFLQETMSSSSLPFPVYLRSCTIHDGKMTVSLDENSRAHISWDSVSQRRKGMLHSDLRAHSGTVILGGKTHLQSATLNVKSKILNKEVELSLTGRCKLSQLSRAAKMCNYSAAWNGKKGIFSFKNGDETIVISPASLNIVNGKYMAAATLRAPLSHCATLFAKNKNSIPLNGDCCLRVLVDFSDLSRGINGTLVIKNNRYNNSDLISRARISFVSIGDRWRGSHHILCNPIGELDGTWIWNWQEKKLIFDCKNKSIIEWPGSTHWTSWPGDCKVLVSYMVDETVRGNYMCNASNKKTGKPISIDGSFSTDNSHIKTEGTVGGISYEAVGSCSDTPYLKSALCFDDNQKELLTFLCDDNKQWEMQCKVALIRNLLRRIVSYEVQGEGTIVVNGTWNLNQPSTQIELQDGTIRLPGTYNFIDTLKATVKFDTSNRRITTQNLICGLHHGEVTCTRATIMFNEHWLPRYVHCPLMIQSCLFTFNKDCFLMASGGMLLEGNLYDKPKITSNLIVDRAQVGSSIPFFDSQSSGSTSLFSTDTFLKNIDCTITITSKHPATIITDDFKAQAQVHMNMTGLLSDPMVSGDIILASGEIKFPYRPLYITRGHIHFIPGKLDDPVIEIIAKNRVKQHNVTMRVLGSAQQHDILFESSPPLTNQQVIALLLAGSSDESLNVIMPALVMQNMKSVMFKSDTFKKSIWRLFRPFRYITLVPSFSDQTGRGGLRGSLEIDIDDRWHALIQKNFSLSEDTLFELEYHISDDIAVRVYRDQRRDVGGEVEVRWRW